MALESAPAPEDLMKLDGNTILITGGSAGIGLALAKEFVALGNKVIVTGRSASKLEAARNEVPALETIQSDAADPDAVRALGTYSILRRVARRDLCAIFRPSTRRQ